MIEPILDESMEEEAERLGIAWRITSALLEHLGAEPSLIYAYGWAARADEIDALRERVRELERKAASGSENVH